MRFLVPALIATVACGECLAGADTQDSIDRGNQLSALVAEKIIYVVTKCVIWDVSGASIEFVEEVESGEED